MQVEADVASVLHCNRAHCELKHCLSDLTSPPSRPRWPPWPSEGRRMLSTTHLGPTFAKHTYKLDINVHYRKWAAYSAWQKDTKELAVSR
jgi:hypothetical protein